MHRTLGSFPTRIRVNRWLFTRECGPKELIAPKRCWTLDLEGSKPSKPRPSPLGPTPWGCNYEVIINKKETINIKWTFDPWFPHIRHDIGHYKQLVSYFNSKISMQTFLSEHLENFRNQLHLLLASGNFVVNFYIVTII